jgi:hypothetical protein
LPPLNDDDASLGEVSYVSAELIEEHHDTH